MISKRIVIKFPPRLVEQPVISQLVKEYNLEFNILKAYVTPKEEGLLILELMGEKEDYERGIDYLSKIGLNIQLVSQDVVRNEIKCTHCGACVTVCPAGALVVDPETRKILFHNEKCIVCELCVPACPPRAMEIHF
jgi:ferredoxin